MNGEEQVQGLYKKVGPAEVPQRYVQKGPQRQGKQESETGKTEIGKHAEEEREWKRDM